MATQRRWPGRCAGIALSLLVSGLLVLFNSAAGHAQPSDVPDGGSRPEAAGQVPLPDGSAARPPTGQERVEGPLAAEIAELEIEVEGVTQQLQSILPEVGPATSAVEYAEQQWRTAVETREAAQQTLDELVGESFRGAAALPPELYLPQLRGWSAHAPVPVDAPLGAQTAARNLVKAQEAEQTVAELRSSARDAEQTLSELREQLEGELADLRDELAELRDRNAELLAEEERAREAAAQAGAADEFPDLAPVDGFEAHPDAVRAVRYALSQLGKPYQWGAEGPDRYDCSGLVLRSYNQVGQQVPRVAADQYQGTRDRLVTRSAAVAQRGLLAGDLVFFSSGPTARSIHHVGIYVGDGQMVHAPNRNEVVKVSPVWWQRFFGATRVIDAVPVGDPPTSPSPPTSPPPPTSPTPDPEPTTVAVPDLAELAPGRDIDGFLAGEGLRGDRGAAVNSCPEDDRDRVVDQDPAPGEQILVGSTVTYHICDPPILVSVPELDGLTPDNAAAAVEEAELDPAAGEPVTEGCDQPGRVVAQDPAAGEEVEEGTEVTYQVCELTVPEGLGLLDMTEADAVVALEERGLPVRVEVVASTAPAGTVVGVMPAPGEELELDGVVTLQVSDGSVVEVPAVEGEPCDEAAETLAEAGLEVEFSEGSAAPEEGAVTGQEPEPGSELAPGELVTLDCAADGGTGGELDTTAAASPQSHPLLPTGGHQLVAV